MSSGCEAPQVPTGCSSQVGRPECRVWGRSVPCLGQAGSLSRGGQEPLRILSLHYSLSKLCFGPLRKPTTQPTSCVAMPYESGSQDTRGPQQSRPSAAGLLRAVRKSRSLGGSSIEGCYTQPFPNAFTHRPCRISETSLWNDSGSQEAVNDQRSWFP